MAIVPRPYRRQATEVSRRWRNGRRPQKPGAHYRPRNGRLRRFRPRKKRRQRVSNKSSSKASAVTINDGETHALCHRIPITQKKFFAVGMPVTRHPPHRPGRAVFSHPVPRLYSLPCCKAKLSNKHSSPADFGYARSCYFSTVEDLNKKSPCETSSLTATTVEPFEYTFNNPFVEAFQRYIVSSHPIVVVVTSQT